MRREGKFRVWGVMVSLRDGGTILQYSTSAGKDAGSLDFLIV